MCVCMCICVCVYVCVRVRMRVRMRTIVFCSCDRFVFYSCFFFLIFLMRNAPFTLLALACTQEGERAILSFLEAAAVLQFDRMTDNEVKASIERLKKQYVSLDNEFIKDILG